MVYNRRIKQNKGIKNSEKVDKTGNLTSAILMSGIYLIMAFVIMLTNLFSNVFNDSQEMRMGFGFLFLTYGLVKGYRFFRNRKNN